MKYVVKNLGLGACLLFWFACSSIAQSSRSHPDIRQRLGGASHSPIYTVACAGEANAQTSDLKWRAVLKHKPIRIQHSIPDEAYIRELKAEKLALKRSRDHVDNTESMGRIVVPEVGTNFLGNLNDGSSPLDNSIAVSDGGIIVSVANATLEIDNVNGINLYYNSLATFINDAQVSSVCDPFVLYDRSADRFILFVQSSDDPWDSHIFVFFSKTNNPASDGWWKYKFTGDPLGDGSWFDYPKVAISNNELYVTGNLFSTGGTFRQSVIYQIDKQNGYLGNTLNWQYWHNISGSPFTLLAVGNGYGQNYGPGCLFVATSASGSSNIKVYDLTDDIGGNPSLNYYTVNTTSYSPAADAAQLGTSCLLDNGDCRALSGFYQNGVIHFVFHSDIGSGWNGINYNRLTVSSLTNQSKMFGNQGSYDYSYPSITPFSTTPTDKSVMIGFGRSSSTIYPEMRVVNCDNSMVFSGSVLVKGSTSYVSYTNSSKERWGDYTGAARRHNSSSPSIWMSGMYGNSQSKWNTWIAEIHPSVSVSSEGSLDAAESTGVVVYPNPIVDHFSLTFSLEVKTSLQITLVDVSGKTLAVLYEGLGFRGENIFTFNQASLSSGTYFLQIFGNSKVILHEKIIVH